MTTLWIGIDMAKASLVAVALWQKESMDLGEFTNNQVGFIELFTTVQAEQARLGATVVQCVVEPTGGYELPLVNFAHEQDMAISLRGAPWGGCRTS